MHSEDEHWRFGPFEVDRRRRLLLAGGKPVKLDSRAFDLLEYLVCRRDDAPTRDEILAHVWRGTTVSENNLSVQLSSLRRALLDNGGDDKLILTLPGRRYRFVGEMLGPDRGAEDLQPPIATAPDRSAFAGDANRSAKRVRVRGAGIAVAAVLAIGAAWLVRFGRGGDIARPGSGLSIVVMPFRNLKDAGETYLADAVTDDLTTELARLPGSLVIARDTAETYRVRRLSAHEIGRSLKVSYLLEGGVSPDETTLQINARLIDTQSDAQVWARRFAVSRDRMGDARDLIVGRIVATLGAVFVQAENTRSRRDRPDNPGALDFLLRARSILDLGDTLADYQSAQTLLESAVARQPDFEEALAELGWLLACKLTNVDDPDEQKDEARARQVIGHALRVSPRDGRALTAHAKLLSLDGDYTGAIASANEALLVQSNDVDAQWVLGSAEYYLGHLDAAALPIEASLRIDPEGPSSKQRYLRLGSIRLFEGRFAEAIACLQKATAGDVMPPAGEGGWGRVERAQLMQIAALELGGDPDKARALYRFYATRWLHRSVGRVGTLAPGSLAKLAGFVRFLDALGSAGMPRFADEAVDDHVAPSASPLGGGDFAPTPLTVPNAATIGTAALVSLKRGARPALLIDLGTGTAVIDGAIWSDVAARDAGNDAFVAERARSFLQRFPGAPIVIMADGPYGVASYNATLGLASRIRTPVYWYRGGEEAWAKAGLPAAYKRSD